MGPGFYRTPSTGTTSNPFGPNAILGNDQTAFRGSVSPSIPDIDTGVDASIHAPQGRKPVLLMSTLVTDGASGLAPPLSAVRTDSRPDFTRGFGLETPEEAEEEGLEEEEVKIPSWGQHRDVEDDDDEELGTKTEEDETRDDMSLEEEERDEMENSGLLTASQSRHHSRHASRLSAALSLRSFGGPIADGLDEQLGELRATSDTGPLGLTSSSAIGTGRDQIPLHIQAPRDKELEDGVEEWTGSEDVDGYGHDLGSDEEVCIISDVNALVSVLLITVRRVLVNGLIRLMKSEPVKLAWMHVCEDAVLPSPQNNLASCLSSLDLRTTPLLYLV